MTAAPAWSLSRLGNRVDFKLIFGGTAAFLREGPGWLGLLQCFNSTGGERPNDRAVGSQLAWELWEERKPRNICFHGFFSKSQK